MDSWSLKSKRESRSSNDVTNNKTDTTHKTWLTLLLTSVSPLKTGVTGTVGIGKGVPLPFLIAIADEFDRIDELLVPFLAVILMAKSSPELAGVDDKETIVWDHQGIASCIAVKNFLFFITSMITSRYMYTSHGRWSLGIFSRNKKLFREQLIARQVVK